MVLAITNTEPSSNPSEGGDISCRPMVNDKGDVKDNTNDIKINNSDNGLIWREHTQHDLPPIPSPSNEEPYLLKQRETTADHPYDTNGNKIPSSASVSNHTRLTLATTRSSRSTDSNENDEDPTLLFDAADSSNASFVEVVESQSSASQAPVIRNWATKYDTDDKDNYDSEEGEEEENACEGLGDSETREDTEEESQEQQDIRETSVTANMPEIEETSIWTCGVSELIAEGQISYHPTPTLEMVIEKDEEHPEQTQPRANTCTEPREEKEDDWGCQLSEFITMNDNTYIDHDNDKLQDGVNDDDEESSAGLLLNTFHPKDDVGANETLQGTTRMVGSLPLLPARNSQDDVSTDQITPANENKNETVTLTVQESMAAELDPLVFELDSLSSQEVEEEVIFQEENCGEENHFEEEVDSNDEKEIPADSPQTKNEMLSVAASTETNDDTGEGDELFSKVTDAISSLCLTPRAQQQLLEEDSNLRRVDAKENADRENSMMTTSSTPDDPNIEVELHRGSDDDDMDKIIVVDAVVKALRKSKKKANQKKEPIQSPTKRSKHKPVRLANKLNAPKRISSDAMDVLMSLTLMECCRSDNNNLSEMSTTSKLASIQRIAANNSESEEISEIEPMDILMALNANTNSNITDCKRRNSDDDNETSKGCRDGIAVGNSYFSEDQPRAVDKESGDSVVMNQDPALIEEPKSDEEIQIMEKKKSKGSLGNDNHNEMDGNEMESPSIGELLRDKRVPTTAIEGQNCNETKQRVVISHNEEETHKFHPDSLVLEKLGQIGDSDSFSIDGFCNKSFSDDNPIRVNPTTMLNNKKPKVSKHKLTMVPLRGDGNNNPTFSGLSTTTSSSFEHLLSLSSSEDCRIPSPPQHPKKAATTNQHKEKEILASSSKAFTLSFDPLPLQNLGLPPMQNLPPTTPLGESVHSVSPPLAIKSRKKKKKKGIGSRKNSMSPPFSSHCSVPSPSLPTELKKDTIKKPSALGDTRQNKSLLHLATNKMIRNAKKTNAARKNRLPKIQKTTSQKLKGKPLRLDIGSIAEDSLRMGRKVYLLPSPSSSTQFDSFQTHNLSSEDGNQENCFPNPCQERLSMPKGIMRVKGEGDPKTPSNHNRSVHWDEKQLANKVEKGIMVGVSSRKCRPIRVLQKHWLEITAVQNGYGSELEQILGFKTTAQGYIC